MPKKVYWAVSNITNDSPISKSLYFDPIKISNASSFNDYDPEAKHNNFKLCPAYLDFTSNLFGLKFPIDYTLAVEQDSLNVKQHDQDFFEYFVGIRDFDRKFFSYNIKIVFFCDQDLDLSLEPPFLEDNDIANKSIVMPGKFNIGKWLRPIDFAFFLKQDVNEYHISRGDIFNYARFHCNEPVELIKFEYTKELMDIQQDILKSKMILGNKSPKLSYYYQLFQNTRYKKRILDIIHKNLLED